MIVAISLLCSVGAHAQSASWPAAERIARAHFAGGTETLIELAPRRDLRIGPVFWARRSVANGGFRGNLVFVRGTDVLYGEGEEALRNVLRADRVLTTNAWSATTLLTVMQSFHVQLPFATDPIREHRVRALRPRIDRSEGTLRLTMYTHRQGPPEATSGVQHFVTRAVLTLDSSYAFNWTTAAVVLDAHGREH